MQILIIEIITTLAHLSRVNFLTLIGRTCSFQILGVLRGIFHFYSNSYRIFGEQTDETVIRRHILHLIWDCTVCLCSTKRTLGLYILQCLSVKHVTFKNDKTRKLGDQTHNLPDFRVK